MQIVKWTGWKREYILDTFTYDEISKLSVWAYNQEVIDRENIYTVMSWHLGIQDKKSRGRAKKSLKKNLKRHNYNTVDNTDYWMGLFRQGNPIAFDKYLKSLKPKKRK